ncbi:RidA family protein [Desulfuribacillus alkaliarsenatis]|uniref:Reactive intermediate/imine deaminase n=1 Tax=Desulfuribacillus alkaliarsenatis TaxID=766136 RepID=A0A1E5G172_9FIRM|nr:RidA family protein [Desulfuribacillus alkaliarsenatis]OEF96611.1 reactive intermediate/imine deaminase [Desulfuribacillus alkaliarsenatis]
MEIINTKQAAPAIGPYSQAVKVNGMVFTSGQIPFTSEGQLISDDVQEQTKQCLNNVKAILEQAGTSMEKVVKCTIFIKDMNDFPKINEIYGSFFNEPFPARSCVEVARLPKDVLVEIEAIALV